MPIDLHQRLSEFSYGYGVTREVEDLLRSVGLRTTPFLPNLVQEKKFGFDVKFDQRGAALMLQFKLGQALRRFRRADKSKPAPALQTPFWRFAVDTAELGGQYDVLLKQERGGAEVYYVAPRFVTWDSYVDIFQNSQVLEQSLLFRPSQIEKALAKNGEPDGWHNVVYDQSSVYVCSLPERVQEVEQVALASHFRSQIVSADRRLVSALRLVDASLAEGRHIRASFQTEEDADQVSMPAVPSGDRRQHRDRRLERIRERAATDGDALFAMLGIEAWAVGCQLIAVTLEKNGTP